MFSSFLFFLIIISIIISVLDFTNTHISNHLMTSTVTKHSSAQNQSFYKITCPYTNEDFEVSDLHFHIHKDKCNMDYVYFICPDCHTKIIVDRKSLYALGYVQDFLGNIFTSDVDLRKIVYSVYCPSCLDIPIVFTYKDTDEYDCTKQAINCPNFNCSKPIILYKSDVKILRLKDDTYSISNSF